MTNIFVEVEGAHASGEGRVLPQLSLGRDFEQILALLCHISPTPNPSSSHRDHRDAPTALLKSRAPEGAYQLMSGDPLEYRTAHLALTLAVHYPYLVQARQKAVSRYLSSLIRASSTLICRRCTSKGGGSSVPTRNAEPPHTPHSACLSPHPTPSTREARQVRQR